MLQDNLTVCKEELNGTRRQVKLHKKQSEICIENLKVSTNKLETLKKVLQEKVNKIHDLSLINSKIYDKLAYYIQSGRIPEEDFVKFKKENYIDQTFVSDLDKWLRENNERQLDELMNDPKLLLELSDDEDDSLILQKKKKARQSKYEKIQMLEAGKKVSFTF